MPPISGSSFETGPEEGHLRSLVVTAQHAQANLRSGGVVGRSENAATAIGDADEVAGLRGAAVLQVTHEDPGMAVLDARDGFAVYFDNRFGQASRLAGTGAKA